MKVLRALALVLATVVSLSGAGRAELLEPPPESPADADYEAEIADTVEAGSIEVAFGASGRGGQRPRRSRRLRWNSDSLEATVRDESDALAGGSIEGRAGKGRFGMGRLSPRWGRGLVLGAPAEPWRAVALDRGPRATFRGRSGEGAWMRWGSGARCEAIAGRFAHRSLAGGSLGWRSVALGAIAAGTGEAQGSASLARESEAVEIGFDRSGRWRTEAFLERPLGGWTLGARVRGGLVSFRSLAEPKRSGPARAVAAMAQGGAGTVRLNVIAAMWRFATAWGGARAALDASGPLAGRGEWSAGFEEQHGARRAPGVSGQPPGLRQGVWLGWRGGSPGLELSLRHETWGARAVVRATVRTVNAAGVDARLAGGLRLRVMHTVYRTRRGERLYLPESLGDRLVLRALSGAGARTRVELRAPVAGGAVRATVALASGTRRAARPQWTLEWSRRARIGRR